MMKVQVQLDDWDITNANSNKPPKQPLCDYLSYLIKMGLILDIQGKLDLAILKNNEKGLKNGKRRDECLEEED